jgi:hypothetical protein
MSAGAGTETLDVEQDGPADLHEDRLTVTHARPTVPRRGPLPPRQAEGSVRLPPARRPRSGPAAWAEALRLPALPASLVGAAVALLLVLAEPAVHLAAAAVAVGGLVVLHLLGALLRALAHARRGRAGALRRVEAGRAVLGLLVAGAGLAAVLTVLRGWPALLAAVAGLALVALRGRSSGGRLVGGLAVVGTAASCAAVWWAAVGGLPWRVLVAAAAIGVVVAALRSTSASRLLLAAPCAAVGLAVALHALPWPALLVAVSLPVARRTARAGRPATAPARLVLLLLLVGLALALATGADLPLSAPR